MSTSKSIAIELRTLASLIGAFIVELPLSEDLQDSEAELDSIWQNIEAVSDKPGFDPKAHGPMLGSITELYNFADRLLGQAIRNSFKP